MDAPNVPNPNPQNPLPPQRPPFRPQPPKFWQIVLKDLACTVVGVSLFCVLCFTLLLVGFGALAAAVGGIDKSGIAFTETTIRGDEKMPDKVVVLPIEGIIETDETGFIPEAIEAIRDDEKVRAVVLRVNSPGGTISGSDYYHHLLSELKKDLDIPIVVSMGDMATSGGYYISAMADKIYAERSTTTGSIGVIVSMYNAAELCQKLGVRSNAITSGPMKGMGDFMKEPTPEETAIWQKTVDDSYEQFLSVVKEGRAYYRGEEGEAAKPTRERLAGVKVETVDETASESSDAEAPAAEETTEVPSEESTEETVEVVETTDAQVELSLKDARDAELRKLADGRIYSAADAKELRLIDEIGFLDDAIDAAIELAKLSKEEVEVVRYEEEAGLFDGLLGSVKSKEEPLNKAMKTFSTPKGYYICPRVLP